MIWLYRGGDTGYPNRPTCSCYGAQEKTRGNVTIASGVGWTFGFLTNFLADLFLFTLTTAQASVDCCSRSGLAKKHFHNPNPGDEVDLPLSNVPGPLEQTSLN